MEVINDYRSRLNEIIDRGYYVKIEEYIRKGIHIFRKAPELFLLYTVVFIFVTPVGGFLISGPLTAGFFIVSHRISGNKPVVFEDFFDGFRKFLPLFLTMILVQIAVFFGLILLIIPGIYLAVCYTFAIQFVIFEDLDFAQAMEASRKLVNREWFGIFGLIFVMGLINFLGVICCGIGVVFTIPVTYAALYAAFEDIYLNHR